MSLGEKIKELRYKYKITQKDLANMLNVTRSTICMFETNKRTPTIYILKEISEYFNISIDYLLDDGYYSAPYKKNTSIYYNNQHPSTKSLKELLIEYGYLTNNENLSKKEIDTIMKFLVNNKDFIKNQK